MRGSADRTPSQPRLVRVTHWLTALACFALLVSGVEVLLSHPRFYWGEVGNVNTPPLFQLPLPASRASVATAYNFVLADQNGWSRALHFEAAWLLLFAGMIYVLWGLVKGHFRQRLHPGRGDEIWTSLRAHGRPASLHGNAPGDYNPLQRLVYLGVIFLLFPFVVWTGLAMSPAFTAVLPASVTLLGGTQAARTLHFFASVAVVLFMVGHVLMVALAGFRIRMRAMVVGNPDGKGKDL